MLESSAQSTASEQNRRSELEQSVFRSLCMSCLVLMSVRLDNVGHDPHGFRSAFTYLHRRLQLVHASSQVFVHARAYASSLLCEMKRAHCKVQQTRAQIAIQCAQALALRFASTRLLCARANELTSQHAHTNEPPLRFARKGSLCALRKRAFARAHWLCERECRHEQTHAVEYRRTAVVQCARRSSHPLRPLPLPRSLSLSSTAAVQLALQRPSAAAAAPPRRQAARAAERRPGEGQTRRSSWKQVAANGRLQCVLAADS